MRKDLEQLWQLAEPYVQDAGFDLVEVQAGREPGGYVVRLFIDAPPTLDAGSDEAVPVSSRVPTASETEGPTSAAPANEVSPTSGAISAAATALLAPQEDHPPSRRSVSHEDCERVSRDVSAALDVADFVSHAYQLEVSSPGLDRPLRRERDFARFAGERARVRLLDGVEGRRNFSGILRGAKDGLVEIECEGRSFRFSVKDVAKANLVPDWDKELKRSAS